MIKVERDVIENGSVSEMRSALALAKRQQRGAIGAISLMLGYWMAATRGNIKAYSEGNYILTEKGEKRRLALASSTNLLRQ